MALPAYGVLIGTLNHYEPEPPDDYGNFFHGLIFVNAPAGLYRCAVDVGTPSGIKVEHRQLHALEKHYSRTSPLFPTVGIYCYETATQVHWIM